MAHPPEAVSAFFDAYAKATDAPDLAFLGLAYGETFMFAGPDRVQAVTRDDFLRVVPRRRAFFAATGLVASQVRSLDAMDLDEQHILVRVEWALRFEKDPERPIVDQAASTYVLRGGNGSWQIVFQLDHQDLTKRVQELGLSPPSA